MATEINKSLSLASDNPHPVWKLYQTDLARRGMAAVYDSHRQVVVMFGGFDSQEIVNNETWEFDGTSWQKADPDHSPPARAWHGLAYDGELNVVVLFGGNSGQGGLNDTWEYDGTDWVQVVTEHAPSHRMGFGMTYDACRQKVVLFGGGDINSGTWEYNGTDWQEIVVSTDPGSLFLTAMAFDPARCRAVLFGGDAGASTASDKTWEYDGADWILVDTTTSPIARWAHALAYDPERGKIVLFGGYGPQWPDGTGLGDTWEYDGTEWVETSPAESPSPREQHILVQEGTRHELLLFGGWGNGETWFYGNEYSAFLPWLAR